MLLNYIWPNRTPSKTISPRFQHQHIYLTKNDLDWLYIASQASHVLADAIEFDAMGRFHTFLHATETDGLIDATMVA